MYLINFKDIVYKFDGHGDILIYGVLKYHHCKMENWKFVAIIDKQLMSNCNKRCQSKHDNTQKFYGCTSFSTKYVLV